MDTLRGPFSEREEPGSGASDDDVPVEANPAMKLGGDERRMQVRAYNFWAGLLDNRTFPDVARLNVDQLTDFGPYGILLDFTGGLENPAIPFVGAEIMRECGADAPMHYLSDVPGRSLLTRITDHYMQILANQAPIGFEAEFVNQRGATILYRGIMLPFSRDDRTIDHIFGVINWKEMAEPVDGASVAPRVAEPTEPHSHVRGDAAMAAWADGPATAGFQPGFPEPEFGLSAMLELGDYPIEFDGSEEAGLGDLLAAARDFAVQAGRSEDRSRAALYAAVGRAWDFAIAALAAPEDLAELAEDAGIACTERAPFTPVVKLVFGADYDKTRLAEFAAVLAHAQRLDLAAGTLADFLAEAPGGLKGVVREERRLRQLDKGVAEDRQAAREKVYSRLRELPPCPLSEVGRGGDEFTVLVARRMEDGRLVLLGEVAGDEALLDKAARHLVG